MKRQINLLFYASMLVVTGCACWRCQSYITDTDMKLSGQPSTFNRYWIRTVNGMRKEEYEKRIVEFENQYPGVYSPGGLPVTIELSRWRHTLSNGFIGNSDISEILVTACTYIFSLSDYAKYVNEQMVEVILDVPSGKSRRFKVHGVFQKAESTLPLCYLACAAFENIHDDRLCKEHVGGYGYDDARENAWDRMFYNDVHAIVLATAYALMELEAQNRNQSGIIKIGH